MTRMERSIEINVPAHLVYRKLTQFNEFSRFMEGVHRVHQLDDTHLHWCAEIGGKEMEWDSEIAEQVPDQCIAWRNTSGPKNAGKVIILSVQPDKSRIVWTVECDEYAPPQTDEASGNAAHRHERDLTRLKKLMECENQETRLQSEMQSASARTAQRSEIAHTADSDAGSAGAQTAGQKPENALENLIFVQQTSLESKDMQPLLQAQKAGAGMSHPMRRNTDARCAPAEHIKSVPQNHFKSTAPESQTRAPAPQRSATSAAPAHSFDGNAEHQQMQEDREWKNLFSRKSMLPMPAWSEQLEVARKVTKAMSRNFHKLFGLAGPQWMRPSDAGRSTEWTPHVEVLQRDMQLLICADLPGIKKEDIQLKINGNQLTIEGERHKEELLGKNSYPQTDRIYGHFYRAISLAERVDFNVVRASLHDGILEIAVPLPSQKSQGRRIEIQCASM